MKERIKTWCIVLLVLLTGFLLWLEHPHDDRRSCTESLISMREQAQEIESVISNIDALLLIKLYPKMDTSAVIATLERLTGEKRDTSSSDADFIRKGLKKVYNKACRIKVEAEKAWPSCLDSPFLYDDDETGIYCKDNKTYIHEVHKKREPTSSKVRIIIKGKDGADRIFTPKPIN